MRWAMGEVILVTTGFKSEEGEEKEAGRGGEIRMGEDPEAEDEDEEQRSLLETEGGDEGVWMSSK